MAKEILIADSEKGDQEMFHRIFKSGNYELAFADNGEDALLKVKLFKPDLVIAGAGLKEKSGLELCETLKNDPEFKDIPFILLTGMFEEVPERDSKRVGANGVISKPLREKEVQALVGQLLEGQTQGMPRGKPLEEDEGWTTLSKGKPGDGEKKSFPTGGLDEDEEEIVELVDIVEEPEPKMSIHDFIASGKGEPAGDIPPLDSWDKIFEEEKKAERRPAEGEEVFDFQLSAKPDEGLEIDSKKALKARPEEDFEFRPAAAPAPGPKVDLRAKPQTAAEDELFEKIELEEILEKVERLQPIIEKEWPKDLEIDRKIDEALPLAEEKAPDKWLDLEGFEAALKTEVMPEGKEEAKQELPEEKLEPFSFEEPSKRAPLDAPPLSLETPSEEEFFDKIPEGELSLDQFLKETLPEEEPPAGRIEEDLLEEILPEKELLEKELPLAFAEEDLKEDEIEFIEEVLRGDEIRFVKEPPKKRVEEQPERREEKIDFFQELEAPGFIQAPPPPESHGLEAPDFVRELSPQESLGEEVPRFIQELQSPSFLKEAEPAKQFLEEVQAPAKLFERQTEEVIGKGVQEMMEGFITKVLPEMTQNILNLTADRIEKMVKEILPDLAEKAIQEEIRRLKKGDKD